LNHQPLGYAGYRETAHVDVIPPGISQPNRHKHPGIQTAGSVNKPSAVNFHHACTGFNKVVAAGTVTQLLKDWSMQTVNLCLTGRWLYVVEGRDFMNCSGAMPKYSATIFSLSALIKPCSCDHATRP
jgi:hypothetical protein